MAIQVKNKVISIADPSATFSSVADCKTQLGIPFHGVNTINDDLKTQEDEWEIDSDGNVYLICYYENLENRSTAKDRYMERVNELAAAGSVRLYKLEAISALTV